MFIGCFDDLTLRILCLAAVVSLVIGIATEGLDDGWFESGAILAAIGIVVTITTVNEYSQAQQFRNLFKKSQDKKVKVVRDGRLKEIDNEELLVGDIFEVETGLIMPTDALLVEKHCNIVLFS
jgi:magnesium-transporting ATPase (P-type)